MPFIVDKDQCTKLDPFPGVSMFVTEAEKMTLSLVEMEPHSVIEEHHHPHEQVTFVAEGELYFFLDGEPHHLRAGDLISVPSNVPHCVQTLSERVRLVDSFTPLRDDFLGEEQTPG